MNRTALKLNNEIMTFIKNTKLTYLSLAVATALVMAFVVVPQLPQVNSTIDLSTSVEQASAWGSSCGGCGGDDSVDNYGGGGGGTTTTVTPPVCDIKSNLSAVKVGDTYTITWNVQSATAVNVYINGYHVEKSGSASFDFIGPNYEDATLTAENAGGNCSDYVKVVNDVPEAPTCDISSNLSAVTIGNQYVISWNVQSDTPVDVKINNQPVNKSGSATFTFVGPNYEEATLVATNDGGTCTDYVKVVVKNTPAATCDAFTVSPSSLPYGGGNVTLNWETTNANSVSISGIGTVTADGSKTVHVSDTTIFTLTADGTNGDDSCTAKVTVGEPNAPVCNYLNASDTSVSKGEMITLSWDTEHTSDVSINNGIGSVASNGSKNVVINNDITYILTAKNGNQEDTCSVHINVDEEETPRCDFFDVDDSSVEEGDRVELSWGTTNADSVRINQGIGSVSKDGDISVRVYDDVTFILTAETGNKEDTCRVDVEVDEEDDEPRPKCELDVSDSRVSRGEEVTLEWETDNADDIEIEDDNGHTIFDTDDYSSSKRKKYYDGEIDVVVYEDTEFTLTARGDGGKRECDVTVRVDDDITVYEKRDQDLVISLTQVPYTGFEAGPFLTYLFYGVLTLWALFIAYILVIRKSSIFGFSLYPAGATDRVAADMEARKKVEALVAKYAGRNR